MNNIASSLHDVKNSKAAYFGFFTLSIIVIITLLFPVYSAPNKNRTSAKSRNASLKLDYIDTCQDVNLSLPDGPDPYDWQGEINAEDPFSNLVPISLKAGVVTLPYYLSTDNGITGDNISQMWDVEFFDEIPDNGSFFTKSEFNTTNLWPNDTDPSLVARSNQHTENFSLQYSNHQTSSFTIGDLGSVTLPRDAKYVRARLRHDLAPFPDRYGSGVYATTLRICPDGKTKEQENCTLIKANQSFAPAFDSYYTGGLIHHVDPTLNYEYTNSELVGLAPGTVTIPYVYTFDKGPDRASQFQDSEVGEVEFLNANNEVIATSSKKTKDLKDGADYFYSYEHGDLGEIFLPEAVTSIRVHHLPNYTSMQDTTDSFYIAGILLCYPLSLVTNILPPLTPGISLEIVNAPNEMYETVSKDIIYKVTNTGQTKLENVELTGNGSTNKIGILNVGQSVQISMNLEVGLGKASPLVLAPVVTGYGSIEPTLNIWASGLVTTNGKVFVRDSKTSNININRIKLPV
jgi:hypothetical protein